MGLSQLFIYYRTGSHLLTIKVNHTLFDATWTPCGNIVFTTYFTHKVITMSEPFGRVITTQFRINVPLGLSVSNDNVIFVAVLRDGVYQSTNDGVSWNLVFKPPDGVYFFRAIEVTTDNNRNFWILVNDEQNNFYLHAYSLDESSSYGNVTWRDIKVTMKNGKYTNLYKNSLLYDGNMSILLCDSDEKAIHVLSVKDQCHYQILSLHHVTHIPRRLAIDKNGQELFVGQEKSAVGMFKLIYGNGRS